jgi:hypothetical protein
MATRRELTMSAQADARALKFAWRELFSLDSKGATEGKLNEDMYHVPPGFRFVLEEIIDESVEHINDRLDTNDDIEDGEESFDFAVNALITMAKLIGNRMFQMGQHLAVKLPHKDMTPCLCSTLYDDELEDFLKEAAGSRVLKGDGWIIYDFNPNKKLE